MEVTHPAARESIVSSGSLDAKEQVRQAVDIVDLVGHYIQLRRQGRGYVGLCPWHDDSRPSLQVNPERQSFKCWVCDIGGDVFSFIMQMEGISFRESLEMLAERAGIELKDRPAPRPGAPAAVGDKQTLFRAMAWAESLYHKYLLESPDAEAARRYLSERGITAESIEKFHIGFAPNNWEWILSQAQTDQAHANSSRAKVLEAVGLLGRRDGGGTYDRFRGRVLFSIRDTQNRPVGLGGRILPEFADEKSAKYYNTSDTPLFSKSNLLYALDVARQYIHKKFDDTALVMEGYTDVIMAHQYGFENSVAVLGTALGEQHVKILKRFAKRVVLVLDGDQAGQDRANQVLELFIAQDLDLQVLTLPDGSDPCDYLQKHGAEGFQRLLDNEAVDALEHARRVAVRGIDLQNDVHGATAALERVLSILAKASRQDGAGGFREDKILQRLATGFGVAEVDVRQRLKQLRRATRRPLVTPRQTPLHQTQQPHGNASDYESCNSELAAQDPDGTYGPPLEAEIPFRAADLHAAAPCEYELLEVLIKRPDLLEEIRGLVRPGQLTQAPCHRLYETICRLSDEGQTATFERLMLEFDTPAMKAFIVELDESERTAKAEDAGSLLLEIIRSFERIENQRQDPAQVAALKNQGLDESQKQDLLLKMLGDLRARHGISESTDG